MVSAFGVDCCLPVHAYLDETVASAGAVQVVGQATGLVVAAESGTLLPTCLALDHAAAPDCIRQAS